MSSSFIGQSNEKGGAYASLFYTVLTMSLSPIWPLGQNPLPGDPFVIINKQTNELAFIDQGKIQKYILPLQEKQQI